MQRKKVGKFVSLTDEKPIAIYPSQRAAALIEGVSRQAINQAIRSLFKVNGHYFMELPDDENKAIL
jgi:hypothetical protein